MEGFRLAVPIAPRFRDTDAMGHINNAVYLSYFEVARMAYWRAMTGSANYQEVPFILAHTSIDFRSPAFVHEELVVGIRASRLGNRSFDYAYRIEEATTGRLVCEGKSVQVIFDYAAGVSMPLSEELRAKLTSFDSRAG